MLMSYACWVGLIHLTQARISWKEGNSAEELLSLDWTVGLPYGIFLIDN